MTRPISLGSGRSPANAISGGAGYAVAPPKTLAPLSRAASLGRHDQRRWVVEVMAHRLGWIEIPSVGHARRMYELAVERVQRGELLGAQLRSEVA